MPSLYQALVYNTEQDGEIPASGSIPLLSPCTDSHPLKNGYSAVSLDSRTGHLEGKDVAKGVKRGSQASRMEGLLGGGSMLTLSSDHTEAVGVEEEQGDPKTQAWKPALPCSNSWRLSPCEGAKDR